MRIMHVIGSREEAGEERLFLRLTAALAAHGEEVLCVLRPSSVLHDRLAPGVDCELVRMRSIFDPFARARIGAVARAFGAEVVQTWLGRATRLTRLQSRREGLPVHVARVGGHHDVRAMRHADAWIASTPGTRAHLVQAGLPAERVFHVPRMVGSPAVLAATEREALRRELGIAHDDAVAACLGRLHRERGVDLALEALARLPERVAGRRLRLVVVGDGSQRRALARQAAELGLGERVRWAAAPAQPLRYLALADVLVYPSRESAVASGILEAWNHGVPVVASASAGARELIEPGVSGTIVPVEDVDALARAMRRVLEMPAAARAGMVEAARRRIARGHGASAVVAAELEVYSRLLPASRASAS